MSLKTIYWLSFVSLTEENSDRHSVSTMAQRLRSLDSSHAGAVAIPECSGPPRLFRDEINATSNQCSRPVQMEVTVRYLRYYTQRTIRIQSAEFLLVKRGQILEDTTPKAKVWQVSETYPSRVALQYWWHVSIYSSDLILVGYLNLTSPESAQFGRTCGV